MSVRHNVKDKEKEYGTIVNFGRGTVAMHECLRYTNHKPDGYLTFTSQEKHEIGLDESHIVYNTVEEMENGAELHFLFDNIEGLDALMDILSRLRVRMTEEESK